MLKLALIFSLLLMGCGSDHDDEKPPMPPVPVEPGEPERAEPSRRPFCIDPDADPEKSGPYKVRRVTRGRVKLWIPQNLPQGCISPIFHYSNGTGAYCGLYGDITERMASHGYTSSCYESRATGSGEACMAGLAAALKASPNASEHWAVSSGHSQGGSAASMCAYLWRKAHPGDEFKMVVIPVAPAWGMSTSNINAKLKTIPYPTFVISGSSDTTVSASWIRSGWRNINEPKWWYVANGAGHMGLTPFAKVGVTAFAGYQLLGLGEAAKHYFEVLMPRDRAWTRMERLWIMLLPEVDAREPLLHSIPLVR